MIVLQKSSASYLDTVRIEAYSKILKIVEEVHVQGMNNNSNGLFGLRNKNSQHKTIKRNVSIKHAINMLHRKQDKP